MKRKVNYDKIDVFCENLSFTKENSEIKVFTDNEVEIYFDFSRNCCENFGVEIEGLYFTEDLEKRYICEKIKEESDLDDIEKIICSGNVKIRSREEGERSELLFQIDGVLLTFYNEHNGYYGHHIQIFKDGKNILYTYL